MSHVIDKISIYIFHVDPVVAFDSDDNVVGKASTEYSFIVLSAHDYFDGNN